VVFKGGVYTDTPSFNPVVDRAVTKTGTLDEPTFAAPGWYPALPQRLNRLERGDKLVTLLGQFNPEEQAERVYDELSFDVYYHTDSTDWEPPAIKGISSEKLGTGDAMVTIEAQDNSGIETAVVAYTDGDGVWESLELTENGGAWSGSFPDGAGTRFFVQVVDKAGNVAVRDNEGQYFEPGEGLFSTVYLPLVVRNG
jgi:hypothetical protein